MRQEKRKPMAMDIAQKSACSSSHAAGSDGFARRRPPHCGHLPRWSSPRTAAHNRRRENRTRGGKGSTWNGARRSRRTQPQPPHGACCHAGAAPHYLAVVPPIANLPRLVGTASLPKPELPCPPCAASRLEPSRLASPASHPASLASRSLEEGERDHVQETNG
jgi:hypothetical protein